MVGKIVYVTRTPLLVKPVEGRVSKDSNIVDKMIARIVYYKHYGVQVSDEEIIHFHCPSIFKLKKAKVEKVKISDFIGKDGFLEYEKNYYSTIEKEQILKRAEYHLNTDFDGYNIRKNNCEHFAYWCATGEKKSHQNPGLTTYKSFLYAFGGLYSFFISMNIFSEIIKKNEL